MCQWVTCTLYCDVVYSKVGGRLNFIESVDEAYPIDGTVTKYEIKLALQPAGTLAESETVPLNSLSEVALIVELPEDPTMIVKLYEDADIFDWMFNKNL